MRSTQTFRLRTPKTIGSALKTDPPSNLERKLEENKLD